MPQTACVERPNQGRKPARKKAARKFAAAASSESRMKYVGKLPYRPKSFTVKEMRLVIKNLKKKHPELT